MQKNLLMPSKGLSPLVCFAHGKESGPWGTKITHLAAIARESGFEVISPDYSQTPDPNRRVAQLIQLGPRANPLVLVGSSMGAYVSAMASAELKPQALFLMAPALYFDGFAQEPTDIPRLCTVVHGWGDEIVPLERALRFAARHRAELVVLDADHGLSQSLDRLGLLFQDLLRRSLQASQPESGS